ncbi:hypothetical protein J2W14_003028 [Pseudarthrobacter oxydans]|uniref:hypothetical protein n=1 Tax=Pseudarthrobacter oxydans TaxID=1671 RepID=UPI002786FF0D|nr:hypothetical protein [Pseudarthrobacter oxydans]MDP9983607.1 hypothetical protein [Pseudarthrobacter oxydans]
MDDMSTLLNGLDLRYAVSVAELGGEEAIYQQRQLLAGKGWLIPAVDALCREWPTLINRENARDFLVEALQEADLFTFDGLADVISLSPAALSGAATHVVELLRAFNQTADLRQDMALELWTRLAIGGWCSALEVRAALATRATHAASVGEDASPYLVRSLGAAFDRWNDNELEEGLRLFADAEDSNSDSLMELGFHSIGRAAAAGTLTAALDEMRMATVWFTRAEQDDDRRDAHAFALITGRIHHFGSGNPITPEDVTEVEDSVYTYLSGFVGEEPHWRQPRADTSASWARLISSLAGVADLHQQEWMDAANLIAAAADVYIAHRSLTLVIDPSQVNERTLGASLAQRGIATILQPQIENGLAAASAPIAFLDRWLAREKEHHATGSELPQFDTVAELRQRLVEMAPDNPKAGGGSDTGDTSTRLGETPQFVAMKAAAAESPEAAKLLDEWQRHITPLNFAQEELLERLIKGIHDHAEGNSVAYDGQMRALVSALIRFTARYLDQLQSGQRKVPWLRPEKTDLPGEDVLADSLDDALYFAGLNSKAEVANVGGGRVDVLVEFQRCRFAIEVKRELTHHTDDQLVSKYGTQAVQYAATDVTAVFLAVLDYFERQERLDIDAVFWTRQLQLDPLSRKYALTALRVQAHVDSPSASSRRSGYGRVSKPNNRV